MGHLTSFFNNISTRKQTFHSHQFCFPNFKLNQFYSYYQSFHRNYSVHSYNVETNFVWFSSFFLMFHYQNTSCTNNISCYSIIYLTIKLSTVSNTYNPTKVRDILTWSPSWVLTNSSYWLKPAKSEGLCLHYVIFPQECWSSPFTKFGSL